MLAQLNSFVEILIVMIVTAGGAMAFLSWRIYRLQYPPELRWPKKDKLSRFRRRRK